MNHRTYDGQRFSPLARINKDNVKGLKLAYTVALGGMPANEYMMSTPLAEDGFLYVTDSAGVLYKIDGRAGRRRPRRLAHGSRPGEAGPQPRRRAVGQSRHHRRRRTAADHRDQQGYRQGRVGNRVHGHARSQHDVGAACDPRQDHRRCRGRRQRRARLDGRPRRRDRKAAVAPLYGSGSRRTGQRDLEGQEQRLADRRRRHLGHRHLRSGHPPDHLGHRQSCADVSTRPTGRATISTPTARSPTIPTPAR